jgi:shikimate dehydrogenase
MSARKAFVIGWPIAHSRSPLIHRFWLKRHSIDGDYSAVAVPSGEAEAFLGGIAGRGFVGGNVTLPHKEAAFRACRRSTPVAARLGAANTLWLEDGALSCDNTDVYGFTTNLDEGAPAWRSGRNALVLGAGGSARAVIHALTGAKFSSVVLLNRTVARAEELARQFGPAVTAGGLGELRAQLSRADLVVNTISAALKAESPLPIDWRDARADSIATDLIYVPLVTPFLAGAAERGLVIVGGLGMLLHQAVPGFERWFGVRPAVDEELRRLVATDIGA